MGLLEAIWTVLTVGDNPPPFRHVLPALLIVVPVFLALGYLLIRFGDL